MFRQINKTFGFCFSFFLFFASVKCARLSWPYRQLLSARKCKYIVVSYL